MHLARTGLQRTLIGAIGAFLVACGSPALAAEGGADGAAVGRIVIRAENAGKATVSVFTTTLQGMPKLELATTPGPASYTARDLAPGVYTVTQAPQEGWALDKLTCNDPRADTNVAERRVTIALKGGDSIICTFMSVEQPPQGDRAVNFFNRRQAQVIVNGTKGLLEFDPDAALEDEAGSQSVEHDVKPDDMGKAATKRLEVPTAKARDEGPQPAPLGVTVTGDGSDTSTQRMNFSSSLADIAKAGQARKAQRIREAGVDAPAAAPAASQKLGLWSNGTFGFSDTQPMQSSSRDGRVAAGIDTSISPGLMVGAMTRYGTSEEKSSLTGLASKSNGIMTGPYAAARFNNAFSVDGRVLVGAVGSEIEPYAASAERTGSTNNVTAARLTGRVQSGPWSFSPAAEVVKLNGQSSDPAAAEGRAALSAGRLTFGPEVGYTFAPISGTQITPKVSLKGVVNYGAASLSNIDVQQSADLLSADDRRKLEANVTLAGAKGATLDLTGAWEEPQQAEAESWSSKVRLAVPLQ